MKVETCDTPDICEHMFCKAIQNGQEELDKLDFTEPAKALANEIDSMILKSILKEVT